MVHFYRNWKITLVGWCAACLLLIVAACSSAEPGGDPGTGSSGGDDPGSSAEQPAPEPTVPHPAERPAELVFLYPPSGTEELFMDRFGEQIQKKFPQYSLKFIERQSGDSHYANLLSSNQPIDILIASSNVTGEYLTGLKLENDISDLIKKYDYDLTSIEPSLIEAQREMAGGGIYGLPYNSGAMVFLYNKDLFDKFGVDYPEDGMTWDELYDLAGRMTRTDSDQKYRGIVFSLASVIRTNQMSAPYFDPESHKALFTDDVFTRVFENVARFFEIPGMELPNNRYSEQSNLFLQDQTVAMMLHTGGMVPRTAEALDNWDIATVPSLSDRPGVGFQAAPDYFYITSRSADRDAAFQVLAYMTSEEYQTWMASHLAFIPALSDPSRAMQSFGSGLPGIQGKNVQALIPREYARMVMPSKYTTIANREMNNTLSAISSGIDLNTALREAAERADQQVQADLEANK